MLGNDCTQKFALFFYPSLFFRILLYLALSLSPSRCGDDGEDFGPGAAGVQLQAAEEGGERGNENPEPR